MNKRKFYKNKEKLRAYRKRYNDRYYGKAIKTATRGGQHWTDAETAIVLFSPHTDTEIALKLNRTIRAIQLRRNRHKDNAEKYFPYYREEFWNG